VFAVAGEDPVVVGQRVGAADLCGLLTGQRRIGPHPTLPLEADSPLVEATHKAHLLVHLDEFVLGEVGHVDALANAARFVEYLYSFVGIAL